MGEIHHQESFYPLGVHCDDIEVKWHLMRDGDLYVWRVKTWELDDDGCMVE